MNNNTFATIETDKAISAILGNFSEDYIQNTVSESLEYKFRPFNTRMPNFPATIYENFAMIKQNMPTYLEDINEKELEIYNSIIDIICDHYHLAVIDDGIPDEYVYTACYYLYQILVSEFSERLINFFSGYAINNISDLLTHIPEENKTIKTNYSKKMYEQQDYILLYDNTEQVLDIIAGLDIPFVDIMRCMSDDKVSKFLDYYFNDCSDIYKYFFASYIINPATRIDTITSIKLNIVRILGEQNAIMNNIQ